MTYSIMAYRPACLSPFDFEEVVQEELFVGAELTDQSVEWSDLTQLVFVVTDMLWRRLNEVDRFSEMTGRFTEWWVVHDEDWSKN